MALVVKVAVAPRRVAYLRRNCSRSSSSCSPSYAPLRVLRILRVAAVVGLNTEIFTRLANQRGMQTIVLTALKITVAGGSFAFLFERQTDEATISSIEDAIWWAFVTSTTVGYGDAYPVTTAGCGIAVVLMLLGIAALSALTATVAAFLTRKETNDASSTVVAQLQELRQEIVPASGSSAFGPPRRRR